MRIPTKRHVPLFIALSCLTACTGVVHGEPPPIKPAMTAAEVEARGFVSMNQAIMYNLMAGQLAERRKEYTQAAQFLLRAGDLAENANILKDAAHAALYAKEYGLVEEAADSWLRLEPNNLEPRQLLAIILLRQNRTDAALVHIDALFNSTADNAEQQAHILVKLISREVEPEVAVKLLAKLANQHPDNLNLQLLYSKFLLDDGKTETAQQVLDAVLTKDPGNQTAAPLYLQTLRQQGKLEQAATWLQTRVEAEPDKLMWRELFAHLLVNQERYADAIPHFQFLLKAEPDNPDNLFNLGLTAFRAHDYPTAQTYFDQVLQHESTDRHDSARYLLGEMAEEQKDLDKALEWYRALPEDSRYHASAQARIILLLLRQERRSEALEHLRQFDSDQAADPNRLRHLEAELLIGDQHYAEALGIYNDLLSQTPDDKETLYARAMLGEQMGNLDLLEQDLRRVIELQPDHVDALNALGYTLADRTQRYQEAHDLIKQALELKPDAFHILDSMGWVLYRLGKPQEALTYLQRALDQRYDPEVASHVIEVLWTLGDKDAAQKLWRAADQAFPDDKHLQRVQQQFTP